MNSEAEANAVRDGCGFRELEDSVLRIHGEDSRVWLNGQLTNDVAKMDPNGCLYALMVSVKGRVQSDMWVYGEGAERFAISLPHQRLEAVAAGFDRQIIMEDVEVERDPRRVVTVQGPGAAEVVKSVSSLPAFPASRLGLAGFDWLVPADQLDEVTAAIEHAGAHRLSRDGWNLARLRGGIPAFGFDFDQESYPQEAGLKDRAVSFLKGCYVGQEVVCTLENRGRLRRRLVRLESTTEGTPGTELFVGDRSVGKVTSGAMDGEVWRGLGYVRAAEAVADAEVEMAAGRARVVGLAG